MHQSLAITDGLYGILSQKDIRDEITTLGNDDISIELDDDILNQLVRKVIEKLRAEKL